MKDKQTEALKLALEALEYWHVRDEFSTQTGKAITAIKEALAEQPAQPEQCECPACKVTPHASDCAVHNKPAYPKGACDCGAQPYPDNFIDALMYDVAKRDSEAQQAYEDAFVNGTGVMIGDKRIDPAIIYKQPEQEPVARSDAYDMIDRFLHNNLNSDADYAEYLKALDSIYTTPPQRKPLTDEEIFSIWRKHTDLDAVRHTPYEDDGIGFARAIEAAHGIKE